MGGKNGLGGGGCEQVEAAKAAAISIVVLGVKLTGERRELNSRTEVMFFLY